MVYYTPTKVVFGKDAELQAGAMLAGQGARKVLIHYGSERVVKTGLMKKITDLLDTFSPHEIVLSGAIYEDKLLELKKETDTLHIPVHFLRTDGAVFLTGLRP